MDFFNPILNFFVILGDIVTFESLSFIVFGIFIVAMVVATFVTTFSIELRTSKAVDAINSYLEKKPFVNEENLVEFNKLMKTIPKPMRYQWQQYMLNREDAPSKFLTQQSCIEAPFKSSSYNETMGYTRNTLAILAIFAVLLGAAITTRPEHETGQIYELIMTVSLLPGALMIFGTLFIIFLKARKRAVISDLYYNFDYMVSSIDKAVETIPPFVDYEILFSKKEIKQGIPALQDYLEQRAIYEQDQIERAKASAVEHDKYDFSELDINGSLVMERAMRESEFYHGNRRRLMMEIENLEGDRDSQARTYSEASKGLQRKLRDVKETLERLRDNLENATNKIDSNYIRKQQADEIKKQQTLEKEMTTVTNRFNKTVQQIEEEIAKRQAEIDSQRHYLEKAMNTEFDVYAKKVYDQLDETVKERNKDLMAKLVAEKEELESELDSNNAIMVEKEVLYKEKMEALEKQEEIVREKDEEIALKEEYIRGQDARIRELESGNVVQRFFDANGNEFFYDEDGSPYYKDARGNMIYYDNDEVEEEPKPEPAPEPVKKAPAKKAPAKKAPAKKTTATTKKPVAKKAPAKKPAPKAEEE